MFDLQTKSFAKVAFRKGFVTREQLKAGLKTLHQEEGARSLAQIFLSQEIMTRGQVKMVRMEIDNFYKSSTIGDINPSDMSQTALLESIWFPQLSNYDIVEPLAEGGMGMVFRAIDKKTRRSVAIKFLKKEEESSQKRFMREIKIVKSLSHPNILPILDAGREKAWTYFTMPIVYGKDLDDWIFEKGALPPEKALKVIKVVAKAIVYAHKKKVIHRDLKPSNIMIDQQGTPLLTDFGLAKHVESDSVSITRTGSMIGTPEYMSPEQACGATNWISFSADIYGLGAVLYFCLTGRPPFVAETLVKLIHMVVNAPPKAIEEFRQDVPPEVISICMTCLAKDPRERYPSARDLVRDIDNFLQGKSPLVSARLLKKSKGGSTTSLPAKIIALLFFLILTTLAIFVWLYPNRAREIIQQIQGG